MKDFATELRDRRLSLGLSVADAAARAGVEGPNYRAWEAGRRTPDQGRQALILAALARVPALDASAYQRGALWALSAMHETLARCYRELAQPAPSLGDAAPVTAGAAAAPAAPGLPPLTAAQAAAAAEGVVRAQDAAAAAQPAGRRRTRREA